MFLAANGLPVRSHVVLALGGLKLNASAGRARDQLPGGRDRPPPAAETITAAELKKILAKQLKKKKKK